MWYLIVSIPDLCNLTYFNERIRTMESSASYRANKPNEAFDVCSKAVVLLLLTCCWLLLPLWVYVIVLFFVLRSLMSIGMCKCDVRKY